MDPSQVELYGRFPRRVGTGVTALSQNWVYSDTYLDLVADEVNGVKNMYSTIAYFNRQLEPVFDKISIDFDSPEKPEPGEPKWGYDEAIKLKEDNKFAKKVLGPVCDDVNKVAKYAHEHDQRVLGVFTGFGIHFHLRYEEEVKPEAEFTTTVNKLEGELELESVDTTPVGDTQRILRVPNIVRVEEKYPNTPGKSEHQQTGIWLVPLNRSEMLDITPIELMKLSESPRKSLEVEEGEIPEMQVYEDWFRREGGEDKEEEGYTHRELDHSFDEIEKESLKMVLKRLLRMPCMYERIVQDEPDHMVRFNSTVLLLNIGLSRQQIFNLYRALEWVDWKPSLTKKMIDQIYRKGYSEMSCQSIQRSELCTRMNNPIECPTYGWSGGKAEWRD